MSTLEIIFNLISLAIDIVALVLSGISLSIVYKINNNISNNNIIGNDKSKTDNTLNNNTIGGDYIGRDSNKKYSQK